MHGPYDKSGGADRNIYRGWNIGFFALPALLAIALIALTIIHPTLSTWISEAVQAEFVNTNLVPEPAPVNIAQPGKEIQTIKVN